MVEDYTYYLRMERRLSPNTVKAYAGDVQEFCALYDALQASPEDITEWLSIRSQAVKKRSQARELSALKSFFDWLVLEGYRKSNPCERVDAPKISRYLPVVLSVEEVVAIIESVKTDSWTGLRDKAILEMLYGSGLRVSEVCSLKLSHFYPEEGFARIVGKGDKERIVPVSAPAADAMREYLALRPAGEDIAFVNRYGDPLSRVSVFKMVKRQAALAGITKEISPHTFRHSFATHMVEGKADLRSVQELLGHESILTTEIYTHIDKSTWQKAVLENHPMK